MSAAEKLGWRRSFPPGVRRPPTSPAALPPASPGGGRRKVALLAQGYRIHRACRWIRISAWRAAALQTSEGWCGREARRGQLRGAGRRVSCIPVAQSFALPCRSRSWFRCPASGRFGPSAQVPTGHTLPFAPLDTRNARAQRGRDRPAPMAQAVGAGTRLPRRERAHAAGLLPTGTRSMARRGQPRGAARRVSCIPVAQSFALPCRSRSWFRCPTSGRFGPSAQQPTGLTLPCAPQGRSQRWRGAGAGEARTHGASGGRGDASTAAGAGACNGASAGRCGGAWPGEDSRGVRRGAFLAPFRRSQRSRRLRSPQRRPMPQRAVKGQGPFDISERRPSPYRAQRGRPLTAAARAKQLFTQKRLTRRKDGAIIPASNAEGGRAGMKAARMDHSSAYYFTFSFTFARKALLRCAV